MDLADAAPLFENRLTKGATSWIAVGGGGRAYL